MNIDTRIKKIEEALNRTKLPKATIWVCRCGDDPCTCSEDHRQNKCQKWPSGGCKNCKETGSWRLVTNARGTFP